ncbi:hypothetical protein H2204_002945 [Knufia peltigerae]|uniref:Xylanolytic transcriptional activator regulatory domain-containing protein n=1 Tax=Knufia peltigerae TaxID=1002370 RepID=A0AA38YC00_9EURO|nr:hypothetical protein H2204_002945 [Knufia peltigerae]
MLEGIESKLAAMAGSISRLAATVETRLSNSEMGPNLSTLDMKGPLKQSGTPDNLPPLEVIMAAADLYFEHCHNRPYSLFHEVSFKAKLAMGQVPRALVFAILASAARYPSTTPLRNGPEAIASYAIESWKALVLPWNGIEDRMGISIVQTILLLAIIDYTDGKAQGSWIKVGLAIRIIQDFGLMREPDAWLSVTEQEERRRVFWSFYICDKLMSCGREKPLAMLDEACKVRLPSGEDEFRSEKPWRPTATLDEVNGEMGGVKSTQLSPFAMSVRIASVLGQCTRYTLGEQGASAQEVQAPWSPTSRLSTIHANLLQIESDFRLNIPLAEIVRQENSNKDGSIDAHKVAPLIFSRTLFHLCHCLLRHPIMFRRRLLNYQGQAPLSFLVHSMDTCRSHAQALVNLMQEVKQMSCPSISSVGDPFYGYCVTVAATIHALFLHSSDPAIAEDARACLDASLQLLEGLAKLWRSTSFMVTRLRSLRTNSARFAPFLHPSTRPDVLGQIDVTDIVEALDYGRLSTPLSKTSWDAFNPSNIPSPVYDDLLNLFPLGYTRPIVPTISDSLESLPTESWSTFPAPQPWLDDLNL